MLLLKHLINVSCVNSCWL